MGLRINTIDAKIGIETIPSNLEISRKDARLNLKRNPVNVQIRTERPKVKIDQYEAFSSMGLKNYIDIAKEAAQRGYQQVMEYIEKYAQDGDMLAAIENGGNPLADIAQRDAFPVREFRGEVSFYSRPRITVEGELEISTNANPGFHVNVLSEYEPGKLNIKYTRAKVNIYLRQRPEVNIKYVGGNIDRVV